MARAPARTWPCSLPSVECVIAIGTPTNLATWPTESNGDPVMVGVFNATAVGRLGPEAIGDPNWSPARVASKVNADVLLGMQTDDRVLPQQQLADYVSRSPTTRTVSIQSGPDPYLHGTIGEAGRATLVGATQVFVDRAIAAHAVKTAAAASGCSGANTTLSRQGVAAFRTATACLVSRSRKMAGSNRLVAVASAGASRSTVSVVGAVTPARVIAKATSTASARRILMDPAARKISVKVAQATKSRVTFTGYGHGAAFASRAPPAVR